jgi:secreted PhoX family phosphatase
MEFLRIFVLSNKSIATSMTSTKIFVMFALVAMLISLPLSLGNSADATTRTTRTSYIDLVDPVNDSITSILSTGDEVNGYVMGKVPDGLGAIKAKGSHGDDDKKGKKGQVTVYMNHELNNGPTHFGKFAQVSKVTLDKFGNVVDAKYVIDGTEGYERFCSSSIADGNGFKDPFYFTNEEVNNGIVVAINTKTDTIHELPWLGEFSHENTINVPMFWDSMKKIVLLSFEDGEATESEVYMYVANSVNDLLAGNGQLYVFGGPTAGMDWDDIHYTTGPISGKFIPVTWDHATQNEVDLDNAAIAAGGMQFIRPEDGAVDKRSSHKNVVYWADTGNNADENNVPIPPSAFNGQGWIHGRMFKFTFTDKNDFTKVDLEILMDGDDSAAPGYNFLTNPDNIDTSKNSLMIQEDRIGPTRISTTNPAFAPFDVTKNAKIIRYDLTSGTFEAVAYLNQLYNTDTSQGDWESSGIIDASELYGKGSWLLDAQAHSLERPTINGVQVNGPDGQLLLMNIEGS